MLQLVSPTLGKFHFRELLDTEGVQMLISSSLIWTVWTFQEFSIAQILLEINFWDSRSAKSAILTHCEAQKFDQHEFLHFLNFEMLPNWHNSPKTGKNGKVASARYFSICDKNLIEIKTKNSLVTSVFDGFLIAVPF